MNAELPPGFVRLKTVCPSIIQDIRYFTDNNFVGRRIDGYEANCAILSEQAAACLNLVQQEFNSIGFCMVIYEAYRPQKATQNFLRWSQGEGDDRMQRLYYPRLPKSDLFNKGYISSRSAHTRGAAVDVSIIELGKKLHPTLERKYKLSDGTELIYLDDGSVDMGAHFDLLDEASWHDNELVTKEQSSMRNLLREKMEKHGFKRYDKEWWHYSLKQEPFPDTYFDFDITG